MNTQFNVSDQELAAATGGILGLIIEAGSTVYEATKIYAEGNWMQGHHPPHHRWYPDGSRKTN